MGIEIQEEKNLLRVVEEDDKSRKRMSITIIADKFEVVLVYGASFLLGS